MIKKRIESKLMLTLISFFYCVLVTLLYTTNFSFKFLSKNFLVITLTMGIGFIINGIFLFSVDSFIRVNVKFRDGFFKNFKSLWISYATLLPVSLGLTLINLFVSIPMFTVIKVITVSIRYVCPFVLLWSYKLVNKESWDVTIKVVSITFLMINILIKLFCLI